MCVCEREREREREGGGGAAETKTGIVKDIKMTDKCSCNNNVIRLGLSSLR